MSAVGGTSGTLKASKPRFSSQMKEFLALGKKVFHEKDIGDYDQLLDDKKELEEKLLSKSKELSSFQSSMEGKIAKLELSEKKLQERIGVLQSDKKTLLKEFGEQYKLWDTKTNRQTDLEKEVNSLQTMLTSANHTVESLHAQVGDLQNQVFDFQVANDKKDNEVKMARRELSSKERELTGATKDAELYQAQLEEQRKEVELESLDVLDMTSKFSALAEDCHRIAKRYFHTQLPKDMLLDSLGKMLDDSGFIRAAPRKTPLSNSVPSQYFRMATAERVIGDKLCTNIFRRYYLPDSVAARGPIDEILERFDAINPRKEAIFRRQLLAAYEPDEPHHLGFLVDHTIEEVFKILNPLIFTKNTRDGFASDLAKLLRKAVDLWRHVQRSEVRGIAQNNLDQPAFNDDQEECWATHDDYDTPIGLTSDQLASITEAEPMIVLFPKVFVGSVEVFQGFALWSDQSAAIAANIEYTQQNARSAALGRGMPGRRDSDRRRLSTSSSIGRRGEEPSTVPRSPPGNQSFQDRANNRNMSLPGTRPGDLGGNPGGVAVGG